MATTERLDAASDARFVIAKIKDLQAASAINPIWSEKTFKKKRRSKKEKDYTISAGIIEGETYGDDRSRRLASLFWRQVVGQRYVRCKLSDLLSLIQFDPDSDAASNSLENPVIPCGCCYPNGDMDEELLVLGFQFVNSDGSLLQVLNRLYGLVPEFRSDVDDGRGGSGTYFLFNRAHYLVLRDIASRWKDADSGCDNIWLQLEVFPVVVYAKFRVALRDDFQDVQSEDARYRYVNSLRHSIINFSTWSLPMTYVGLDLFHDKDHESTPDVDVSKLAVKLFQECTESTDKYERYGHKGYCNVLEALIRVLCTDDDMQNCLRFEEYMAERLVPYAEAIKLHKKALALLIIILIIQVSSRLDEPPPYMNPTLQEIYDTRTSRSQCSAGVLGFLGMHTFGRKTEELKRELEAICDLCYEDLSIGMEDFPILQELKWFVDPNSFRWSKDDFHSSASDASLLQFLQKEWAALKGAGPRHEEYVVNNICCLCPGSERVDTTNHELAVTHAHRLSEYAVYRKYVLLQRECTNSKDCSHCQRALIAKKNDEKATKLFKAIHGTSGDDKQWSGTNPLFCTSSDGDTYCLICQDRNGKAIGRTVRDVQTHEASVFHFGKVLEYEFWLEHYGESDTLARYKIEEKKWRLLGA